MDANNNTLVSLKSVFHTSPASIIKINLSPFSGPLFPAFSQKNTIWVDKREVKLIPGMMVTAEVKTGKRRILEFFMAPLLRYKQESIRER